MTELETKVFEYLNGIVEGVGYELVDVTYKKQYGIPTMTIFIWKMGGVSLDDCEIVHNAISSPLDDLNPTGETAYHLNVSSPGLDRPIVTVRDYERNVMEEIEVVFKEPYQGKKKLEGRLISVDSENKQIVLEVKNNLKYTINMDIISVSKPVIRF